MTTNERQNFPPLAREHGRPCPVCREPESVPLRRVELTVPEGFALQDVFTVNRCVACGAVLHDVDPQVDRDSYYETYTGPDRIEYQITPEQARFNEMAVRFLEHAALGDRDMAILDVGCSFGITLMSLRERGYANLYAMDPDRAAIRYLDQQGIAGRAGFATDPCPDLVGRFDLILLRHVLEHLYDPGEALDNVVRWLKPGGRLYIELPDLSRYQETSPFPGYFFEHEHINHFSLFSLLNLTRRFTLLQYESTASIYPCQRALFEAAALVRQVQAEAADALYLADCLDRPSGQGRVVLDNIAALDGREIALWGVSKFVYRLLSHTDLKKCNIRHLVDSNPLRQRERLLGLPIEPPETLKSFHGDIVICGERSSANIERAARAIGLENNIIQLLRS